MLRRSGPKPSYHFSAKRNHTLSPYLLFEQSNQKYPFSNTPTMSDESDRCPISPSTEYRGSISSYLQFYAIIPSLDLLRSITQCSSQSASLHAENVIVMTTSCEIRMLRHPLYLRSVVTEHHILKEAVAVIFSLSFFKNT